MANCPSCNKECTLIATYVKRDHFPRRSYVVYYNCKNCKASAEFAITEERFLELITTKEVYDGNQN